MKVIFSNTVFALCILSFGTACGESGPPPFTAPRTLQADRRGADRGPGRDLNHGQKLFNRYCASCHGYEGGGDGRPRATSTRSRATSEPREFLYVAAGGGQLADRQPISRPRSATA
jgi:mono/diheme cytochrome c family protein